MEFNFIDMTPFEIKQQLQDSCDNEVEDYFYQRKLTDSELQERREEFVTKAIEIEKEEDEKKELVREINERLKKLRSYAKTEMRILKTGREDTTETVYEFLVGNQIITYNSRGEEIGRKVNAKGIQGRLFKGSDYDVKVG